MDFVVAFIIGAIAGIFFVLNHESVVLIRSSSGGSLWIKYDGKTYDLVEHKSK